MVLTPSFVYSWSISHILEPEFFCLGNSGQLWKIQFEILLATFEGRFFNFVGKFFYSFLKIVEAFKLLNPRNDYFGTCHFSKTHVPYNEFILCIFSISIYYFHFLKIKESDYQWMTLSDFSVENSPKPMWIPKNLTRSTLMESVIIMAKRAKKSIGLLGIVCELLHRVLEQGSAMVVHTGIMIQIFSVGILSKVVRFIFHLYNIVTDHCTIAKTEIIYPKNVGA